MLGIFLDQETTGLDSYRHNVLEIALRVIDLATGEEVGSFESIVSQPHAVWEKRDLMAIEINGFCEEELQTGTKPEKIGEEIIALFTKLQIQRSKAVFICANPSFDRPFFSQLIPAYTQERLNWPYHWLDLASMYWALFVKEQEANKRSLPESLLLSKDSIATSLSLPKEQKPHRAMQGVDHLLVCYRHIVGYPERLKTPTLQ
jgi:oligoribonuclease